MDMEVEVGQVLGQVLVMGLDMAVLAVLVTTGGRRAVAVSLCRRRRNDTGGLASLLGERQDVRQVWNFTKFIRVLLST